jgi:hypothetical protein
MYTFQSGEIKPLWMHDAWVEVINMVSVQLEILSQEMQGVV